MWPNPSEASSGTARAFFSKPAASPSGLSNPRPPQLTRRRSSRKPNARWAARRGSSKRPASSHERSARSCARSGSRRNSTGRMTVSYTGQTLTQRGSGQRLVERALGTQRRAVERDLRRPESVAGRRSVPQPGHAPLTSLDAREREMGPEGPLLGAVPAPGFERIRNRGLQGRRPVALIVELQREQARVASRQRTDIAAPQQRSGDAGGGDGRPLPKRP